MKISIEGLDKARVLAALYNATHPQGLGFLHWDPADMTTEAAQELLDEGHTHFDYLYGRVMKVDLSGDAFDSWGYDRDNYLGAAQAVIARLRSNEDEALD